MFYHTVFCLESTSLARKTSVGIRDSITCFLERGKGIPQAAYK